MWELVPILKCYRFAFVPAMVMFNSETSELFIILIVRFCTIRLIWISPLVNIVSYSCADRKHIQSFTSLLSAPQFRPEFNFHSLMYVWEQRWDPLNWVWAAVISEKGAQNFRCIQVHMKRMLNYKHILCLIVYLLKASLWYTGALL